jgi:hypothetical protein
MFAHHEEGGDELSTCVPISQERHAVQSLLPTRLHLLCFRRQDGGFQNTSSEGDYRIIEYGKSLSSNITNSGS